MIRELKTYVVTCDHCQRSLTILLYPYETKIPPGWDQVRSPTWGRAGYPQYSDHCPICKRLP